nr:hypothetical protein [Rhodococcus aetherivorans]
MDDVAALTKAAAASIDDIGAAAGKAGGAGGPLGQPSRPFAGVSSKNPVCRPAGRAAGSHVGKSGASPGARSVPTASSTQFEWE